MAKIDVEEIDRRMKSTRKGDKVRIINWSNDKDTFWNVAGIPEFLTVVRTATGAGDWCHKWLAYTSTKDGSQRQVNLSVEIFEKVQ